MKLQENKTPQFNRQQNVRMYSQPLQRKNEMAENGGTLNAPTTTSASKTAVAFTGAEVFTTFLRFLETNQAWGATAVDLGCMGIPRTTVDFTRGPDAGFETMRREFSSTADDALVGAYGLGAAFLLSQALNKEYGIKAHKMFIGDEMLDISNHIWNEKKSSPNQLRDFVTELADGAKGFNPEHAENHRIDEKGFVGMDKITKEEFINKLEKEIKDGPEEISKETKNVLKALYAGSTGADSKIKLEKEIDGKTVKSVSSLEDYIKNSYKMGKAFMNENVAKTFETGNASDNVFIKSLKRLNKNTAIIGIGVATAIGCSLQPLNIYLTKKKTGKSGFVGVEGGREPDKSTGFKLLKLAVAAAGGFAIMRSIGKPSEILGKIQFKGLTPTIAQFKLVYGMTVISRFLAARDKNELRESSIKDSLGFVNWLILGGFVSKLAAAGIEKLPKFKNAGEKFVMYNKNENGKGFFNWLTKSGIITRDEILHSALKKAGISTIKANGQAMTFTEMMKAAPSAAKTKVRFAALIQISGYLYSGLVLGMGIPKLNIAITNSIEKKRKAKEALKANEQG